MNPRMYVSVLVCVAVISTAMTAPTKTTKKEKNASSQSSSTTASSLLAFQPAQECAIRKETTGGTTSYHLVGTVGRKATVLFSDRPTRVAKNVATETFVYNFDDTFVSSKPNTVVSFSNEEDDPLIVVITEAKILRTNQEDGGLVLEYDIEQLGSQSNVSSIEEFVGLDRQDCSIFVDDFASCGDIVALLGSKGFLFKC